MSQPLQKRTAKIASAANSRLNDVSESTVSPTAGPKQTLVSVLLVSGGTGRTAQHLLAASLAQFPSQNVNVIVRHSVRTGRKAKAVVNEAARMGAVLLHTLVDPKVRHALDTQALVKGIPYVDILGPAMSVLGEHLASVPSGRAGLLYELNREQIDRMDAVDFTLAHDDGQRMDQLDQADVVLVGASRTSKSVTCFYLASRGILAANVPLIPGHPMPKPLTLLDPARAIGLTMNATHLVSLRRTRLDLSSHRRVDRYAELEHVVAELREIRSVMTQHRWQCIDVSYKATEEVTDQIIEMIGR